MLIKKLSAHWLYTDIDSVIVSAHTRSIATCFASRRVQDAYRVSFLYCIHPDLLHAGICCARLSDIQGETPVGSQARSMLLSPGKPALASLVGRYSYGEVLEASAHDRGAFAGCFELLFQCSSSMPLFNAASGQAMISSAGSAHMLCLHISNLLAPYSSCSERFARG